MFPCVIVFGVCVFVVVVFVFRNVCCCVFEDCVGVCVCLCLCFCRGCFVAFFFEILLHLSCVYDYYCVFSL